MPLPPLLIFDMDGVLVDVRSSYRQVVIQTVQSYLGDCLGLALPPGLVTPALVETCKLMGGFNNDWDLTAGLIGYFLTHLPSAPEPAAPVADLDAILACLAQTPMPADAASRLQAAADRLDSLTGAVRQAGGGLPGLRQVMGVRNQHLFQEIYFGPTLFMRFFAVAPRFRRTAGLVDTETRLVNPATLAALAQAFRLGIATGRPRAEAAYALDRLGLAAFFEVCVTHDDVAAAEAMAAQAGAAVRLGKPSPWPLLAASAQLDPAGSLAAAYLGDTPDDMLAALRARAARPFLAIGVSAVGGDAQRAHLLAAGADLVLPTVDDLLALI
jgi:HAD superfamily hydrolase (TIGR01548 family)